MNYWSGASNTLGNHVRQARERAGLSLRNLEAITGIPRATLNRLELDQIDRPNPLILQRVADALELDVEDLFVFVGYRPSENLPSLAPYLRAKYHLSPTALAEAHEALRHILDRYDQTHAARRTGQNSRDHDTASSTTPHDHRSTSKDS